MSLVLGQGFLSCLEHEELLQIITLTCQATLAVDLLQRGVAGGPKIWEIAKVRNGIQHRLCSLDPPSNNLSSHEGSLYNIVRLATLIYSDLVLFPLAEISVKARLAYDLRKALGLLFTDHRLQTRLENELFTWSFTMIRRGEEDLVTWCIAMGAMASYETVHQEWYVERLAQSLREDWRLLDWVLFQNLMSHFLWWDYVLQLRCWDIWNDAVQILNADRARPRSNDD